MKWVKIDTIYSVSYYQNHPIKRFELKTGKYVYLYGGISFNTLVAVKKLIDYKITYKVNQAS